MCSKNFNTFGKIKFFIALEIRSRVQIAKEERRSKSLGALFPVLGAEFDEEKMAALLFPSLRFQIRVLVAMQYVQSLLGA